MKETIIYFCAAAVIVMTLAGCGNEDEDLDTGLVAPVFSAVIDDGQSRVVGSLWEPGDEISIWRTGANAVCYVTESGNGVFTAKNVNEQIYYNGSKRNTKTTFRAYYPRVNQTSTSIAINTLDQTQQSSFNYLYATAQGTKDAPEVTFEFSHIMSMVTFVFKNGNEMDVSKISSYKLGALEVNGTLNITNGNITTSGSRVEVSMTLSEVKDGEPVTPLILLPQTISTSVTPAKLIIECTDGLTFETSLKFPNTQLAKGKNYKITITVNKTGLTVNNCTIENWTPRDGGQGTAAPADDSEDNFNN